MDGQRGWIGSDPATRALNLSARHPETPFSPWPEQLAGSQNLLTGRRLLVAISGSIAAVKLPLVVSALVQLGAEVRCVLTPSAERLVSPVALASLSRQACAVEALHWDASQPRPLHIDLAGWAELVLLAPLTATTLARLVHGLADNLLTSTLLACRAPLVVAPAMNTDMWQAPAVQHNWQNLQRQPHVIPVDPGRGLLACDRRGEGRMAEPELLIAACRGALASGGHQDLRGQRILVSAGPTREALDSARCLTNPSSGRMGVAMAVAARLRGAAVTLVHGPLQAVPSAWLDGLDCHPVGAAAEMMACLLRLQPCHDGVVMAAAVADQRPVQRSAVKLPKADLPHALQLEEVEDIARLLHQRRSPGQWMLGFAAQDGDLLPPARAKRLHKGFDWIFANPIDQPGTGFASQRNGGWLIDDAGERHFATADKLDLANQLWSALQPRLQGGVQVAASPSGTRSEAAGEH